MKTANRAWLVTALSVLVTAIFLPTFAAGKVENAPGIQKKAPLEIKSLSVSTTPTSVTVRWTSSQPSHGSIAISYGIDGVGYLDTKYCVHHEVTVTGLFPDRTYNLMVESHTDNYGGAVWSDSFTTPTL